MSEKRNTVVFVYGTLKKGRNNHHFLEGAKYLGEAAAGRDYSLQVCGLPFMQKKAGAGVVGELYEVTPTMLKQLDRLEGHPSVYTRTKINVYDVEVGMSIHDVEAYLYNKKIPAFGEIEHDVRSY